MLKQQSVMLDEDGLEVIQKPTRRDLRKTARGASSPAKPALHIPGLSSVLSAHALVPLNLSNAIRDLPLQMAGNEGRGSGVRGSWYSRDEEAHPLSMTRAATSSVHRETC